MKISPKQYATALHDTLSTTAPKDHDTVLDKFVQVLARNNDLKLFENISGEFHKIELASKGKIQAQVTTAQPLGAAEEKELIHELNELIGKKVELKKKVDAGIVGGVVVQVEDTVIDGSTKRALEDLKNNLSE